MGFFTFIATIFVIASTSCSDKSQIETPQNTVIVQEFSAKPIYLLIRGQSNALGSPEAPLQATYESDEHIKFWHKRRKKWVVATLGNLETRGKSQRPGSYTFALSAAKTLRQHYNRPVYFIVNARSGQKYDAWLRDKNSFFEREKNHIALSGAKDVIVLSHQGESHHRDSPESFLDKVAQYTYILETQDWYSGTIIHGELLRDGRKSAQNPQIRTLEHYVSSDGLSSYDRVHFDSKSLDTLGHRYANYIIATKIIKYTCCVPFQQSSPWRRQIDYLR